MSLSTLVEPFEFDWQLRYSRRKTIAVFVFPDQRVEVRAPKSAGKKEIVVFLHRHRDWVQQQLQNYQQKQQHRPRRVPLQFIDGEKHYYLGEQFPVRQCYGRPNIYFTGEEILVYINPRAAPSSLKKPLLDWYRQLAAVVFNARLDILYDQFAKLGVAKPQIRIRSMRSRWGSCSPNGNINLALELIQVPLEYLDYVIIHEVCHLLEFNHSARFYQLQSKILPDWQICKKGLNEFPVVVLR